VTLSGEHLQQTARDAAAALEHVSTGRPFTPHLEHDSITSGRYLDKQHWISVSPGPGVTKRLIEDLVHDSYDLAIGHRNEQGS
jgi:hypothetical protein